MRLREYLLIHPQKTEQKTDGTKGTKEKILILSPLITGVINHGGK